MNNITIPELSLVVLIGPSGYGKSTFARKHFKPTEVLSSDFCRGLVSDDENNQAATKDAFEILHFIAAKRLAAGNTCESFMDQSTRWARTSSDCVDVACQPSARSHFANSRLVSRRSSGLSEKNLLRRVHECVFGVLALESEPVDPRL
jgi:hypothetical protein